MRQKTINRGIARAKLWCECTKLINAINTITEPAATGKIKQLIDATYPCTKRVAAAYRTALADDALLSITMSCYQETAFRLFAVAFLKFYDQYRKLEYSNITQADWLQYEQALLRSATTRKQILREQQHHDQKHIALQ